MEKNSFEKVDWDDQRVVHKDLLNSLIIYLADKPFSEVEGFMDPLGRAQRLTDFKQPTLGNLIEG